MTINMAAITTPLGIDTQLFYSPGNHIYRDAAPAIQDYGHL